MSSQVAATDLLATVDLNALLPAVQAQIILIFTDERFNALQAALGHPPSRNEMIEHFVQTGEAAKWRQINRG